MASFKDALKNYKATSTTPAAEATPVPLNPPEAVKVLEEQTVPETEGKAEPAPLEVAKPKAARAPRGSGKKSAEPQASSDTEASSAPVQGGVDLARIADALERLVYLKERELLSKVDF